MHCLYLSRHLTSFPGLPPSHMAREQGQPGSHLQSLIACSVQIWRWEQLENKATSSPSNCLFSDVSREVFIWDTCLEIKDWDLNEGLIQRAEVLVEIETGGLLSEVSDVEGSGSMLGMHGGGTWLHPTRQHERYGGWRHT